MKKYDIDILFLQPGFAHYRTELFVLLSKIHKIHFLYESSKNVYPGEVAPGSISHSFLDKEFRIPKFGLIYYFLKYKPKIVISSVSDSFRSFLSLLYAKIYKKRFILWIIEWRERASSEHPVKGLSFRRKLINILSARTITFSDALLVSGTASKKYAMSFGKKEQSIFTVFNCSNDLSLKYNGVKKKNKDGKKITLLYMSRIIQRKGLDLLIMAFSMLKKTRKDVFLLIVGDGPFRKTCENLKNELKLDAVSFTGSISPSKVVELYERADVFILPSRYEPWGLVINEAMSMGLPIITTTGVAAGYDLVKNGYNGFVAKENSVDGLKIAFDNILKFDLDFLGSNSRLIFEKYNNFSKMACRFTEAIKYVNKM